MDRILPDIVYLKSGTQCEVLAEHDGSAWLIATDNSWGPGTIKIGDILLYPPKDRLILDLPQEIYAGDYHEFDYVKGCFQKVNKNIKVKELCYCEEARQYVGLIYVDGLDFKAACVKWDVEDEQ